VAKRVIGREKRNERGRWGVTGTCSGAAVASQPKKATTGATVCGERKKRQR
jgi:hypothetical protein